MILFLLLLTPLNGNPYRISAGAGEAGMGSVCIIRNGFWSSFNNQALLALNTSFSIGINYENRFNIRELGTRTAGLIFPAGNASLGIIYSNFGYPDFRRETGGVACGLKISDKIAAGIQIDYFSERVPDDYGNRQAITCEAGVLIAASEKIKIGLHLYNPVPNSLRKTFLPSMLRIGAGIELSNALFAGAEAEMSTGERLIIRTGFEYEAAKKLWIRGGFSSENSSFSFGLGYMLKNMKLDLSFSTHEKLGITSSASLIFKIR